MAQQKVLVTGAAGFIGSNLCEDLLKRGYYVIGLDNFSTGKKENLTEFKDNQSFKFFEGDIREYENCVHAVKGVDFVLHQAALGSVPRSINNPILTNANNITGFLNILTAAKEAKVKRFIFAASSSTYGDSVKLPKVEDEIGAPLSPYAVTKYVNELYAKVFSDLYGIETIGLRYFNVFGKKQDPEGAYAAAIPKFVKLLISKKSPVINGDGTQSRDFTYIDNVVQANYLALTTTNPKALNTVYNVAYGERTNLNELCAALKEALALKNPDILKVPIIHGSNRVGDIPHSLASIEKAKTLLGYNPKYSIKTGLKEAIDWYWNNL